MEFSSLIEGRLLRRYKRFLSDIQLLSGEEVVAHCPNPGSMKTMQDAGAKVWLSQSDNPKRKLAYTWELVNVQGAMTLVHASLANAIVEEALAKGVVKELTGFTTLEREVKYGEKSRLDFRLSGFGEAESGDLVAKGSLSAGPCFVEVKSVTMSDGEGRCAFPDSVTTRGTRHLRELMAIVRSGHRAVLLFCVAKEGILQIRPADEIDPVYGKTLREAVHAGVEILAYGCKVGIEGVVMSHRIPIELD